MSGHSKWHGIRHKKAIVDSARGKVFTRHSNLITLAVRQGGSDPTMNPGLRLAIDNAKKENVPNANIERAVKRGLGELKEENEITEVHYEGYGPGGMAVIVEGLTDNKNRTAANVKTLFSKYGGNLGESGSVSYLFDRRGMITLNVQADKKEEIELVAIDAGADDLSWEENELYIYSAPQKLHQTLSALKKAGLSPGKAEILFVPKSPLFITDPALAKKITEFMEKLDEDPDINTIATNVEIA